VVNRLLVACGAIGPLLNIVVVLILGATRPGYNAWQLPDSSLELGAGGWIQISNYFISGLLLLGFAVGLRRVLRTGRGSTWGPILLGIYGLSFIMIAIFITDPVLQKRLRPLTRRAIPLAGHLGPATRDLTKVTPALST